MQVSSVNVCVHIIMCFELMVLTKSCALFPEHSVYNTYCNLILFLDAFMKFAAPSLGGDGPSQTLLSYMEEYNFQAPVAWKGFRPLTSK